MRYLIRDAFFKPVSGSIAFRLWTLLFLYYSLWLICSVCCSSTNVIMRLFPNPEYLAFAIPSTLILSIFSWMLFMLGLGASSKAWIDQRGMMVLRMFEAIIRTCACYTQNVHSFPHAHASHSSPVSSQSRQGPDSVVIDSCSTVYPYTSCQQQISDVGMSTASIIW